MRLAAVAVSLAAALSAQEFRLGGKVGDFTVTGAAGDRVEYSSLHGGATTVVLFVSTECPVSNAYNDRMQQLYTDYRARGVRFVFVNSNRTESAADVAAHRRSNRFTFDVYKDPGNVVADRFGATVTPEAYVMDSKGVMRYHGAIDDALNPARIRTHHLAAALDAVLAGASVPRHEVRASGCTIKRVAKKAS